MKKVATSSCIAAVLTVSQVDSRGRTLGLALQVGLAQVVPTTPAASSHDATAVWFGMPNMCLGHLSSQPAPRKPKCFTSAALGCIVKMEPQEEDL